MPPKIFPILKKSTEFKKHTKSYVCQLYVYDKVQLSKDKQHSDQN